MTTHEEFIDNTQARDISIVTFMREFSDICDKERILNIWTNGVLPYLQRHSSIDKQRHWSNLRKSTVQELESTIDKELHERKHIETRIPNVSRQEQAVSILHMNRVEERCHSEDNYERNDHQTSQEVDRHR
ncbi:hypothetical protein BGZ65_007351, partial [Modicella reniformis]